MPSSVDSSGAVDDGAGCAVLLELAKHYSNHVPNRTFCFSATCGEEWGKIGSKDYLKNLESSGTLEKVVAVVNIDAICFKDASEIVINASGDEISSGLNMNLMCKKALKESHFSNQKTVKEWIPPRGFDQQPFYERGIPVATIFTHNDTYYHRSSDKFPDSIDNQLLLGAIKYYFYLIENLDTLPLS